MWQICNFRDPNLVPFYFYELTHFLDGMRNTLLFICSTNILVRLLTINMENYLTRKTPEMCDPIIVNPVVKMLRAQNSNTANTKGVMSCEDKLEGLKLLATKCFIRNPKNNSQLHNFIRSEIKLYKYVLFNKCNQIIDT